QVNDGQVKAGQEWAKLGTALRGAFASRDVWKMAFVAATMAGPMLVIGGLWGTPYLMVAYDLPRPEAAFFMSLLLLGWAVGAPFSGWMSDRIGRRKPILIAGCLLVSILLAIIFIVPGLPFWLVQIFLVLTGLSGGAMTACFGLVRDVMPPAIAGASTGIVNSATVASGAILQPLVGLALDLQWDGTVSDGARQYAAADYRFAFLLILATAVAGLVTAFRLRETPMA
ncbi:MAG TPA: MFS transporter, partial [Alphaproteobacteria bacterium]|nr:MFS transporter [Alphaproteobacteria bacterium]HCD80380.1 MFS transporter [Alphaproteobacteria bacterium]